MKDNNVHKPLLSKNNKKCLTKCIPAGTSILHPSLLTTKILREDACAIIPEYSKKKDEFQLNNYVAFDRCNLEDNHQYDVPQELDTFLLRYSFNPRDFLEYIYGIHDFDQLIEWTNENKNLPFNTIKRVHNSGWLVFGKKIYLSQTALDYYYLILTQKWIKDYVRIVKKKYSFSIISNDESTMVIEIENILKPILTYDIFFKMVKEYIEKYKDIWDKIFSHYGNLKRFILFNLMERLNKLNNVT